MGLHGGEIEDGKPAPVFANAETHWWDGSQIYGSGAEKQDQIRTYVDGRIKVDDDGRLYDDGASRDEPLLCLDFAPAGKPEVLAAACRTLDRGSDVVGGSDPDPRPLPEEGAENAARFLTERLRGGRA